MGSRNYKLNPLSSRLWVISCLLACCLYSTCASPSIQTDQPVWNFGSLTNQAEITHDFAIRNVGDAPLELNRVVSSCDACLRAKCDKKRILPGASALLHSRLDLRSLSGQVTRNIFLHVNDPESPSLTLAITGRTVPLFRVSPPDLILDLSEGLRTAGAEIQLLTQLHAPLSEAVCTNDSVSAALTQFSPTRFLLSVTASDSAPRGDAAFDVVLRSSNPADPPCLVKAFLHNPPEVEITPRNLHFDGVSEPQMRIVWIRQHGQRPFRLVDAIPQSDTLHCEIDPDPTGYNYRIYVTARNQQMAGAAKSILRLKMFDLNQKEQMFEIPISVGEQQEFVESLAQ